MNWFALLIKSTLTRDRFHRNVPNFIPTMYENIFTNVKHQHNKITWCSCVHIHSGVRAHEYELACLNMARIITLSTNQIAPPKRKHSCDAAFICHELISCEKKNTEAFWRSFHWNLSKKLPKLTNFDTP